MERLVLSLVLLALAFNAHGHHGAALNFVEGETVEIEGIVTSLRWGNPHTYYTVAVSERGGTVEYRIEAGGLSELRTRGLNPEFLQEGDFVKVAGLPSRRERREIFGHNLLLPTGEEVLFDVVAKPRWQTTLLPAEYDEAVADRAIETASGIFRVWSTVLEDPDSFPMFKGDYPLTDAAVQIRDGRQSQDYPYYGCFPKPMPHIMVSPMPMEIQRQGNDILIRIEEYDTERIVHMGVDTAPTTGSPAGLGTSLGRWEVDVLVVETNNITPGYFHNDGTPQSAELTLVERFELNETDDRLNYTVLITDPSNFSRPFELSRYWVWKPEVQVGRFDCEE